MCNLTTTNGLRWLLTNERKTNICGNELENSQGISDLKREAANKLPAFLEIRDGNICPGYRRKQMSYLALCISLNHAYAEDCLQYVVSRNLENNQSPHSLSYPCIFLSFCTSFPGNEKCDCCSNVKMGLNCFGSYEIFRLHKTQALTSRTILPLLLQKSLGLCRTATDSDTF
jgi:hypothetical protein